MNRLFGAAERYLHECSWKDMALLKFCLCAIGVLIGISIPARSKKPSAVAAGIVFVATYIPLMAKFLPHLLGKRDEPECGC